MRCSAATSGSRFCSAFHSSFRERYHCRCEEIIRRVNKETEAGDAAAEEIIGAFVRERVL